MVDTNKKLVCVLFEIQGLKWIKSQLTAFLGVNDGLLQMEIFFLHFVFCFVFFLFCFLLSNGWLINEKEIQLLRFMRDLQNEKIWNLIILT